LGINATIGDEVMRIRHQYKTGSSVELRFYVVREYAGTIENRIFREVRWATPSELPTYDFLEADVKLVQDLAAGRII
jgi:8-oxo-dGTP diphosphatase